MKIRSAVLAPCDVIEPLRRPGDRMLWQMDILFARQDAPAFARASYR